MGDDVLSQDEVESLLHAIEHRGPDAWGVKAFAGGGLAHRGVPGRCGRCARVGPRQGGHEEKRREEGEQDVSGGSFHRSHLRLVRERVEEGADDATAAGEDSPSSASRTIFGVSISGSRTGASPSPR